MEPLAVSMRGDLACLSAFELLQTMYHFRKCGALRLATSDEHGAPREASCTIAREGLAEASCGHLRGREAVLTFAWWKQGEFVFETTAAHSDPDAIVVQGILLEAVRLADEIEARQGVLPERLSPLQLGTERTVADLSDMTAASEIVACLAEKPGMSRTDLEKILPFAPVTLGFALARLCEEGRVRSVFSGQERKLRIVDAPVKNAAKGPAILRLLLAFDPAAHESAAGLLEGLERELGCTEGSRFFDPSGISFVRLRPAEHPLLSITTLPVTYRNRFMFESLLSALQFAVFLDDGRPSPELDEWRHLVPQSVDVISAAGEAEILSEITAALRAAEEEPS